MSLRLNGPKKIAVEDVGHRSKRVKTMTLPTDGITASIEDIGRPLSTVTRNDDSEAHAKSISPTKNVRGFGHSQRAHGTWDVDLRGIPSDPSRLARWIAETTQALAAKKKDQSGVGDVRNGRRIGVKPAFPGLFVFDAAVPGDISRTKQRWAKGSSRHGNSFKTSSKQPESGSPPNFPALRLDPGIASRLFTSQKGDSGDAVKRNACGRLLLQCLLNGSKAFLPDSSSRLKATIDSSQDDAPYIAAFRILAKNGDVLRAIKNAMGSRADDDAHYADIASVPNGTEVPSLTTDGDTSGITSQDETPEVEVMDAYSRSRPSTSDSNRIGETSGSPRPFVFPDTVPFLRDNLPPSLDARESAIINSLKIASSTLDEMAHGRPPYYVTPYAQSSSTQHPEIAPNEDGTIPQPFVSIEGGLQHVAPQAHSSAHRSPRPPPPINGNDGNKPSKTKETRDARKDNMPHCDKSGLQVTEGAVAEVSRKAELTVEEEEKEQDDSISLTEAQIDEFLAMANGGELIPGGGDSTEDDRERTISRATTPEGFDTRDDPVAAIFDGIIVELTTKLDHGHGIAFLTPQLAYYQSVNEERFVSALRKCVSDAPPSVNVIMSAEQGRATEDLYRQLERRITRPLGYFVYPQYYSPYGQMPHPHHPMVPVPHAAHQPVPPQLLPPPPPGMILQSTPVPPPPPRMVLQSIKLPTPPPGMMLKLVPATGPSFDPLNATGGGITQVTPAAVIKPARKPRGKRKKSG